MITLTGKNSIAGQWSAAGNQTFTSVDPRTRQPGNVKFHSAMPDEVDRAVNAAAAAFQETRHYPASKLADFLERHGIRMNFAINALFPDAPGDKLGHLGTEIEDQHLFRMYIVAHDLVNLVANCLECCSFYFSSSR